MSLCKVLQVTNRKKRKGKALAGAYPYIFTWKIIFLARKSDTRSFPGHSAAKECCVMHFENFTFSFFAPIKKGCRICHRHYTSSFHSSEASITERSQDWLSFTMNSHSKK